MVELHNFSLRQQREVKRTNLSITIFFLQAPPPPRFIPKFRQKLENSFVSPISIQAGNSFPERETFPLARQLAQPMFQKFSKGTRP